MENWYILNKFENFNLIKDNSNLTSMQKIILANRNIVDDYSIETIYNPKIENLHNPLLMQDMKKAVDILFNIMMNNGKIRIVGDYDQDGVAATVILYKGLTNFYDKISYAIPDRIEDGYGLNKSIVDDCIEDGIDLIITCDNGIAAFESIKYAKEKGITVIVTDHHEVVRKDGKDILPVADAVINPHRMDDDYPFSGICGAVVAYKFIEAVYLIYGSKIGKSIKVVYDLLQYAALGTVCDMMKLVDENRIIVIEGINRINNNPNIGLKILLQELNWEKEFNIYAIGFLIGPTINASGRIYTAKLGVELFLENDLTTVREYARTLVELNNERKTMTNDSVATAVNRIQYEKIHENDIIILYENSIHESICGLVAGRIKDLFNRPTIILTDSNEVGIVKGSGRSISAYNIFENLNVYRDQFVSFGGHAMACGLSLYKKDLGYFIKEINDRSELREEDFAKKIDIDYPLDFRKITIRLINQINELKPYGFGFSEPIFASKKVNVKSVDIIGKNKNVLRFYFEQNGVSLQAISFDIVYIQKNINESKNIIDIKDLVGQNVDIVYKLDINTYNGYSNIQLNIISMR
ncbi:single-stranded-DNA-specific exonuclease RecJ [Helcococcus kunzii]|uniref:single-stranded-DNA-specific exonuclease RecJ n=1 Tax=Helcococcus kunzii TaxID=40091 RepID=UPI0021A3235F|nr:single-stranded-DNA-specific exonuclease RecJ [Helcococcus kunzii]MCT1795493.1 single-stranded-DNA-specific exonuclease RecJ [Helcococcus kunzii]MCT1989173.1 single-stranded-DNA-specific exonuclease RecJ [Helcococcus kunzii]